MPSKVHSFLKVEDNCLHQLHNKKVFPNFSKFSFENWAGQMSAGQTIPKIKSYKFFTFSLHVANVSSEQFR